MGSALASGQNRAQDAIQKALDSPLLNDNKITGAKNVLLLIVSGSHEITIDEIGEINDHIQNEAGHGANIIMGVGEDESLEESIAVTIIATGFNIEQQDEISNTETKRVIHSLGDHDEGKAQDQEPVIISPVIEMEKKDEPEVIKHTLDIENEDEKGESVISDHKIEEDEDSMVKTTDSIKNIAVDYEEVKFQFEEEEDFIIKPVTRMEDDKHTSEINEEEQITLTFDLPLTAKSNTGSINNEDTIKYDLDEHIKNIPVNDYVELIPVTETSEEGDVRYALDDYLEVESSLNNKKQSGKEAIEEIDQEVVFEKKILKQEPQEEEISKEDKDPVDLPISALLKERAEERRSKMKDFNYKFNSAKIDDIEKIPAYRRQGVDLEASRHSSETDISRTSIGTDDNDDIKLRSNNSFLHDNVD